MVEHQYSQGGWLEVAGLVFVLIWYLCKEFPYFFKFVRRNDWPIVDATIQSRTIGRINRGRNCVVPACFIGYAFKVNNDRYSGLFVLVGKEDSLQRAHETLADAPLQVRYAAANPNTSLLLDYRDSRFEGLRASQDPEWLNQSPTLDLQDALRG